MAKDERNVKVVKIDKGIITIAIDLNKDLGVSKSKKSRLIASTGGNVDLEEISGMKEWPKEFKGVKIGVNCYKSVKGNDDE